jgi:hypothetical protein
LTVHSHLENHHLQLTTKHLSAYTSSTTRNQTGAGPTKASDTYFSKPNQPIKSGSNIATGGSSLI